MPGAPTATFLLVMAASPLCMLLTHLALARLLRHVSPQLVTVAASLAGAVPTALLAEIVAFSGPPSLIGMPVESTFAAVVYLCAAYSYFHLLNMSQTARRIRILREIYAAGSLSDQQISALYGASTVLELRLERLLAIGQLKLQDDRYVSAGRLLYAAARLARAWRVLLGSDRQRPRGGSQRPA